MIWGPARICELVERAAIFAGTADRNSDLATHSSRRIFTRYVFRSVGEA
jgi:hypothetical protein